MAGCSRGNPTLDQESRRRAAGRRSWKGLRGKPEASLLKAPKCFCPPPPPLYSDPSEALKLAVWWAESGFPRAHREVGQAPGLVYWVGVPLAQLSAKPGSVSQILGSAGAFEEVGC